jgi:hypothetical protein
MTKAEDRKSNKKNLDYKDDDIYQSENIPRTKKLDKQQLKNKLKKMNRNSKFSSSFF